MATLQMSPVLFFFLILLIIGLCLYLFYTPGQYPYTQVRVTASPQTGRVVIGATHQNIARLLGISLHTYGVWRRDGFLVAERVIVGNRKWWQVTIVEQGHKRPNNIIATGEK